MPYAHTLNRFILPEFDAAPPDSWVHRLREISPVTDRMSHLIFRWREPKEWWFDHHHGMWELYAATPKQLVDAERAEQFRLHWSELPPSRQEGRKAMVSNYQHYCWHARDVEVKRVWVLQGSWGGTAAMYTRRESRAIDAEGGFSEPFPIGMFPPCPFNELAVEAIAKRDRFLQAGKNMDRLESMERPAYLKAQDDLAEKEFRTKFTDYWRETVRPQAEFLTWFTRKSEAQHAMRKATPEENDLVAIYRDHFIEHGSMPGKLTVSTRAHQVAVA